jgi:hypothetical protein
VSRSPAEPRPSRSSAGPRTAGSLSGGGAANPLIGKATGARSLIGNAAAADGPMISGSFASDGAAANPFGYSAAVISLTGGATAETFAGPARSLVGRQADVLCAEAASTERSLIIKYLKIC